MSIILTFGIDSIPNYSNSIGIAVDISNFAKIEKFSFEVNGTGKQGKIYLSASYEINKSLPSIYLIDYTEQHFKQATD